MFQSYFSLTPRFSEVSAATDQHSTASAVFGWRPELRPRETAKAVELAAARPLTPLKRGANESRFLRSHVPLFVLFVFFCSILLSPAAEPKTIPGITEPFLDVTLGASVAGIIRAECFKEGSLVKKGDVLLELDKRLEELEVERRQAVMAQNKMQLDSTRALVQRTQSVSKEELAKKEAEYNISVAEHGIAVEQLAHRQIVAPFSGAITEIQLHPGAACAPYQPLVRLVDTSRCYFVGQVEGKAMAGLKLDAPLKIHVDGCAAPVTGKICFISPVVDPASGLAKVKAVFENADGKIRPGLSAQMELE